MAVMGAAECNASHVTTRPALDNYTAAEPVARIHPLPVPYTSASGAGAASPPSAAWPLAAPWLGLSTVSAGSAAGSGSEVAGPSAAPRHMLRMPLKASLTEGPPTPPSPPCPPRHCCQLSTKASPRSGQAAAAYGAVTSEGGAGGLGVVLLELVDLLGDGVLAVEDHLVRAAVHHQHDQRRVRSDRRGTRFIRHCHKRSRFSNSTAQAGSSRACATGLWRSRSARSPKKSPAE